MTMMHHAAAAASRTRRSPLPAGVAAQEREVQIAAAQLRLITDSKLGKVTPEWVKKLAAEKSDDD